MIRWSCSATALGESTVTKGRKTHEKGAVAAMISPKETFGYYRQLLDYIGEKLGRDVQFIQRKTYGEIIDISYNCSYY